MDGEVAQFNDSLGSSGEWECSDVDGGGGPSDCPAGFVALNDNVCIEQNEKASAVWFDANRDCIDADYRLCSTGEWIAACDNGILSDATGNWEWTDDSSGAFFLTVGFDRCRRSIDQGPTFPQVFRCCVDR